jgi:hypothetical protein
MHYKRVTGVSKRVEGSSPGSGNEKRDGDPRLDAQVESE